MRKIQGTGGAGRPPVGKYRPALQPQRPAHRPWTADWKYIPRGVFAPWICSKCTLDNHGDRACCIGCGSHPSQKVKDLQLDAIKRAKAIEAKSDKQAEAIAKAKGKGKGKGKASEDSKDSKGGGPKGNTGAPQPKAKAKAAPWEAKDKGKQVTFANDEEEEAVDEVDQQLADTEAGLERALPNLTGDACKELREQTEAKLQAVREQRRARWPPARQALRASRRLESARDHTKKVQDQQADLVQAAADQKAAWEAAEQAVLDGAERLKQAQAAEAKALAEREQWPEAKPEPAEPAGQQQASSDPSLDQMLHYMQQVAASLGADDEEGHKAAALMEDRCKAIAQKAAEAQAKAEQQAQDIAAASAKIEDGAGEEGENKEGDDAMDMDDDQWETWKAEQARLLEEVGKPKEGETPGELAKRRKVARQQQAAASKPSAGKSLVHATKQKK